MDFGAHVCVYSHILYYIILYSTILYYIYIYVCVFVCLTLTGLSTVLQIESELSCAKDWKLSWTRCALDSLQSGVMAGELIEAKYLRLVGCEVASLARLCEGLRLISRKTFGKRT